MFPIWLIRTPLVITLLDEIQRLQSCNAGSVVLPQQPLHTHACLSQSCIKYNATSWLVGQPKSTSLCISTTSKTVCNLPACLPAWRRFWRVAVVVLHWGKQTKIWSNLSSQWQIIHFDLSEILHAADYSSNVECQCNTRAISSLKWILEGSWSTPISNFQKNRSWIP